MDRALVSRASLASPDALNGDWMSADVSELVEQVSQLCGGVVVSTERQGRFIQGFIGEMFIIDIAVCKASIRHIVPL
jgi:hypothetical protein